MISKQGLDGIKPTKPTDGENIESFLTVFERIMDAQEIATLPKDVKVWVCKRKPTSGRRLRG